jgi:Uma2 family endonuclease
MYCKINLINPLKIIIRDEFYHLCQNNPSLKLELSPTGELIIMSPTGGETGARNARLIIILGNWNDIDNKGIIFDSSTCFRLPNGAQLSPDVSWILKERWDCLTLEEKKKFPPIAPDFVIELLSPSDRLKDTQDKMWQYMDAGVRLGWIINPQNQSVEIYRLGREKIVLDNPLTLSDDQVLPGLTISLAQIWQ